jgi:hypothetical protein
MPVLTNANFESSEKTILTLCITFLTPDSKLPSHLHFQAELGEPLPSNAHFSR